VPKCLMESSIHLVVFNLDGRHYAVHLSAVERIVLIAEITPLPNAPDIVLGLVNVRGRIIPVINLRKRFKLPICEISLNDCLIVARTSRRPVALVADTVAGVVECSEGEITAANRILLHLEYIEGVVKLEDGLILIHNLETFLSLEEEETLEKAMTPTDS
jgi:purine-binding chemotaxis protein CheW